MHVTFLLDFNVMFLFLFTNSLLLLDCVSLIKPSKCDTERRVIIIIITITTDTYVTCVSVNISLSTHGGFVRSCTSCSPRGGS